MDLLCQILLSGMMDKMDRDYVYPNQLHDKLNFLFGTEGQRIHRHHSHAQLAKACGVPKTTLTDRARLDKNKSGRLPKKLASTLAQVCGFDLDWQEWIGGTTDEFKQRYVAFNSRAQLSRITLEVDQADVTSVSSRPWTYQSVENQGFSRDTNVALRVGPSISRCLQGKERLASILLSFMQSPPGEPWPAILELRCQNDTLDQFEVAVKRGWLQIDAGQQCYVRVKDTMPIRVEGSEGPVSISGPGGMGIRTSWDIIAEGKFIGVITLPEAFCSIDRLTAGDTITARFAAFVKDLENVCIDDDAHSDEGPSINDSISWRRLGYKNLGAAKRAIMMRVAQLEHLPGSDNGWVVLCQEQRTFTRDKYEDKNEV